MQDLSRLFLLPVSYVLMQTAFTSWFAWFILTELQRKRLPLYRLSIAFKVWYFTLKALFQDCQH